MSKSKIVEEIEKQHAEMYGPLCTDCTQYQRWCRCEELKKFTEDIKKQENN